MMVTIVPKGRALMDPCAMATEFAQAKTSATGAGKRRAVTTTVLAQALPLIWKYNFVAMYPPTTEVIVYVITAHAKIDPRLVVDTLPVRAKSKTIKHVTIN
jgi:hypothetical protein